MQTDFTPAPWHVADAYGPEDIDHGDGGWAWGETIVGPKGQAIACMVEGRSYITTVEEREANTEIVVRAPALYALLQRCLPYIKTVSRSGNAGYDANDGSLYEEMKMLLGVTPAH